MLVSVYDLAYGYLKKYSSDEISDDIVTETLNSFKELLADGWTAESIIRNLDHKKWKLQDFLKQFKRNNLKEKNLMKPDEYYWHPQLRIVPDAPKRVVDYDTGLITKVEQPYFLEMRASYTLNDLYWYYTKQHGEPETQGEVGKWKGGLRYLLSQYSLDTVLFMIDASANHIRSEDYQPLNSPLDMADYIREAQRAIGEKITEERTAGDEGIVPKRRIPLSRGRSETTERALQAEHYA